MKNKIIIYFFSSLVFQSVMFYSLNTVADIPPGYYSSTSGLTGTPLRTALHNIIKNHTVVSYNNLAACFARTDKKTNGKVSDMYSDIPGGTPPYEFTFSQACGSYNSEGDCWNKEHSFPQSWFNNNSSVYSDLFHLIPTDGYVNNKRANNPLGDVSNTTWTSMNGSKLGQCSNSGYSGVVFEPLDSFKGDFARIYFYIAVRYFTEDQSWPGSDMVTKSEPKPWALAVLKAWHQLDPVSQKERNRNDSVYKIQHNRNPFVDKPQWVDSVWNGQADITEKNNTSFSPYIYPNPADNKIYFDFYSFDYKKITVTLYTIKGQIVAEENYNMGSGYLSKHIDISSISEGIYFIHILTQKNSFISKIIIQR